MFPSWNPGIGFPEGRGNTAFGSVVERRILDVSCLDSVDIKVSDFAL